MCATRASPALWSDRNCTICLTTFMKYLLKSIRSFVYKVFMIGSPRLGSRLVMQMQSAGGVAFMESTHPLHRMSVQSRYNLLAE